MVAYSRLKMATGTLLVVGVVIDVLCLILVFMPTIVVELGHVQPYRRGFYCDDDSIKYPYRGNTINASVVGVVGVLVPAAVIILFEAIHALDRHRKMSFRSTPTSYCHYPLSDCCSVPCFFVAWYKLIGVFLFGLAMTQAITDICKYSIGRLRPHFIQACQPNITAPIGCETKGLYVYIDYDQFTCTGKQFQHDSRLSFLSGHTSIAAYCATFLIFYLQARFTWRGSKLLRHFLQAVAAYAAIYVGLSRISDYMHHWSDVLSGAVLGIFLASLTSLHVSTMFRQNSRQCYADNGQVRQDASSSALLESVT